MMRSIYSAVALGSIFLASCEEQKPVDAKNPIVVMETSMGKITIQLDDGHAPITVKNFLGYVDDKFYDGTIFHRVIEDFMIQGGGYEPGPKEKKTKDPIKNESPNGLFNERGTIAMARTDDLNSATAQFYINVWDNKELDGKHYCVFGRVIEGMNVVEKIREVKTTTVRGPKGHPMEDVPVKDVVIKSVHRAEKK